MVHESPQHARPAHTPISTQAHTAAKARVQEHAETQADAQPHARVTPSPSAQQFDTYVPPARERSAGVASTRQFRVGKRGTWGFAGRSLVHSFVAGVLWIPIVVATLILLPWIPLVARAVEILGRWGMRWMGHDMPPRRFRRWLDGRQLTYLLGEVAFAGAAMMLWAVVGLSTGSLAVAPFMAATISIGPWTIDNRPAVFLGCWAIAVLGVIILAAMSSLLTAGNMALTRWILSPSAAELSESRAVLIDAFSGERRRIEQQLHDGPQQYLTALMLNLAAAKLADDPAEALRLAEANGAKALQELRTTVRGIAPHVLFDDGLEAALEELLAHSGLETTLTVEGTPGPLGETAALLVYHCVAEGLTNASKHGAATAVQVTVVYGDHEAARHDDHGAKTTGMTPVSPKRFTASELRRRWSARRTRGTSVVSVSIVDNGSGAATFSHAVPEKPGGPASADSAVCASVSSSTSVRTGVAGLQARAEALGGYVELLPGDSGGAELRMSLPHEDNDETMETVNS